MLVDLLTETKFPVYPDEVISNFEIRIRPKPVKETRAKTAPGSPSIEIHFVDPTSSGLLDELKLKMPWLPALAMILGKVLQIKAQAYDAAGNTGVSNVANVTLN